MSNLNELNENSFLKDYKSKRYKTAETDKTYHNPGFDGHGEKMDNDNSSTAVEDSLESNSSTFGLRRQIGVSGATSLIFGCIVGEIYLDNFDSCKPSFPIFILLFYFEKVFRMRPKVA